MSNLKSTPATSLVAADVKEVKPEPVKDNGRMKVSIPLADLYDQLHPGVQLIGGSPKVWKDDKWVATGEGGTSIKFEAGKTYDVPTPVGEEILRRLENFTREQRRLMNPRSDRRSVNQVISGSQWTRSGGGQVTGMDNGFDSVVGPEETVITVDF